MSEFMIIDRVLTMSHTIHNLKSTLQVNKYFLSDEHIHNPVKGLK